MWAFAVLLIMGSGCTPTKSELELSYLSVNRETLGRCGCCWYASPVEMVPSAHEALLCSEPYDPEMAWIDVDRVEYKFKLIESHASTAPIQVERTRC